MTWNHHLLKFIQTPFPRMPRIFDAESNKTPYGPLRMTAIVLKGSVILSVILTLLLIIYIFLSDNPFNNRVYIGLIASTYLIIGEILLRKGRYIVAGWMILILYSSLAAYILLAWGINASVGLLSLGFIIFLSGAIFGQRYITYTATGSAALLIVIQVIHEQKLITPHLAVLSNPAHAFDVMTYVTIFGIFALLSWLSGVQVQKTLDRAHAAEGRLKIEKRNLAKRLEEQSLKLKQTQLKEMLQLYKFAIIGQSTTATLHELSNHLSVLNIDIDDIERQHQHSEALSNAKQSIFYVNELVRQAKWQLHDTRNVQRFNAIQVLEQTVKEMNERFDRKGVKLERTVIKNKSFMLNGDPLSLSHTLSILLNNSLDACALKKSGHVIIRPSVNKNELNISIEDNGLGIPSEMQKLIFRPHQSSKPSGLGIGLYITKHIIESQFNGNITFTSNDTGTKFLIVISKIHHQIGQDNILPSYH